MDFNSNANSTIPTTETTATSVEGVKATHNKNLNTKS